MITWLSMMLFKKTLTGGFTFRKGKVNILYNNVILYMPTEIKLPQSTTALLLNNR